MNVVWLILAVLIWGIVHSTLASLETKAWFRAKMGDGVKRVYEEAALSLGANRFQTFMAVTLPLLMPAVFAGLLFSFTISFDNITATIFWRPPGVETVPTQIFGMLRTSISPEINALGTVMILITVGLPLAGGAIARYVLRARA